MKTIFFDKINNEVIEGESFDRFLDSSKKSSSNPKGLKGHEIERLRSSCKSILENCVKARPENSSPQSNTGLVIGKIQSGKTMSFTGLLALARDNDFKIAIIISGRSDTTLNPGGVRLGTAEIYSEVEKFKEIKESLVVGQSWDNDVRIILFVVLNSKYQLDDSLLKKLKLQIRKNASPRHVPRKIIQIKDIPRTKSGKIVELAVKNVIEDNEIKNIEALANPESLKQFENIEELKI